MRAASEQAVKNDAFLQTDANVIEWKAEGNGVAVRHSIARLITPRMIVAAGAWSGGVPGRSWNSL